jgi:hypothetical protein
MVRKNLKNLLRTTVLSRYCQLLARYSCNSLHHYVSTLVSNEQHGFDRNRSFWTQLLPVIHVIGENLHKNIQTDILYLDFAKAFDLLDHDILLAKLRSYGVKGNLLKRFTDYLHGRFQRVVILRRCSLSMEFLRKVHVVPYFLPSL